MAVREQQRPDAEHRARVRREEEAAARLHALADALASDNEVAFERSSMRITVHVPDEVDLKIEVELGDENELQVELTW